MMGKYRIERFASVKKGFRPRIARGWWIFEEGKRLPIEGPLTRDEARRKVEDLKAVEGARKADQVISSTPGPE